MSDAQQPPEVPSTIGGSVNAALRVRTQLFRLIIGMFVLYFGVGVAMTATLDRDQSRPDVLTWVVLGLMVVELPILMILFDPDRIPRRLLESSLKRGETPSLQAFARTASVIAAVLAATPSLYGVVLMMISSQIWRALIFIPISAVSAVTLWGRVERAIRVAASSGVT